MKTVKMGKDFCYQAKPKIHIQYHSGLKYRRVPEAAVKAILAAKAGKVVVREAASE